MRPSGPNQQSIAGYGDGRGAAPGGYQGGPMTPSKSMASIASGNGVTNPSPGIGEERPLPPPPAGEVVQPGAEPAKGQKNYTQLGMLNSIAQRVC